MLCGWPGAESLQDARSHVKMQIKSVSKNRNQVRTHTCEHKKHTHTQEVDTMHMKGQRKRDYLKKNQLLAAERNVTQNTDV